MVMEILKETRIFQGLTEADAITLFDAGRVSALMAGTQLVRAGEPPDGFYVVVSGRFHVLSPAHGAAIGDIGVGETIGEMGLVTLAPRNADVVAVEPATVWHLSGRGFEALLAVGDPLASAILLGVSQDLCRRFREAILDGAAMVPKIARYAEGVELLESLGWGLD
jgi:CRP-like cAMP-binding protein